MIMYVIKNGTIHTGTGEVLENYDILIEGKKIKNRFSQVSSIHILLSELWGFRLVTEIMQKLQM